MNKKQLIVAWIVVNSLCLSSPAFARTTRHRYYPKTELTKASFRINLNQKDFSEQSYARSPRSGEFSKPSFVIANQKDYHSKVAVKNQKFLGSSFKINDSNRGDFSKASFSVSDSEGKFSTVSFKINTGKGKFLRAAVKKEKR